MITLIGTISIIFAILACIIKPEQETTKEDILFTDIPLIESKPKRVLVNGKWYYPSI
jgi:hypothetical protein